MTWYATLLPDDLGDTDQGESHDHVRVEIDRLLEQGLESGDWEATRTALRVAPKEATSHEGYHLGLATAAFYVDHEAAAAEQSLTEAINCPSSQWRPDSYRLQAIILQALGRNEEAAKAVEQGIFAVEKLSLDDEAKARYRTWVGQALVDPNKQLVAGATIKGPELLDTLLTEASATDDWAFCRKRIDESFQGHSDLEGLCYARAAAAHCVDHDPKTAEKWLRAALRKPESRWRPDTYRLLGVILQQRGDLVDAESALDAGVDAASRMNIPDEEKARYAEWFEIVLQPVRSRLLENDRTGIKAVLRNGILTGERSDKRECREALIALKSNERSWTPDFASALLQARGSGPKLTDAVRVGRWICGVTIRVIGFSPWLLRSTILAALVAAGLYGALYLPEKMCAESSGDVCSAISNPVITFFMTVCERAYAVTAGMLWSLWTGMSLNGLESHFAQILGEVASRIVLALFLAYLLLEAFRFARVITIQKTTRYVLNDGRLTTQVGLVHRLRKNYEILHASAFEIKQNVLQTLLRRAELSFYVLAVGGRAPEQIKIIGRRREILALEKQIRGMSRTMRTLARLKGIVATD